MGANEEQLKVLKMLEEGKIKAEDAARLLEVLELSSKAEKAEKAERFQAPAAAQPAAGKNPPRWMRVTVTDTDSGKTRVNVRLPITLVSSGMKMGMRFSPEVQGMDIDTLMNMVNAGECGTVVDVYDDQDGEHVQVILE